MMILDILSSCNDVALLNIMAIAKKIIGLIQLIGPIICIISMVYTLFRMMQNPDDKKSPKRLKNSAIALVVIFFLPIIINAFMYLLGENMEFSSCWINADGLFTDAEYKEISTDSGTIVKVYEDPSHYQSGVAKSTDDSSSSSSGNKTGNSKIVFIGDSRTVQMYAYSSGDWGGANYSTGGVHEVGSDIYVAEGAQGLSWMKSTGIPAAQKYFNNKTAIVILMGVNDLGNVNEYASYINENADSWKSKGSSLYYVSVNPCNGSYSGLNSKIESFNSKLKSSISSKATWIDTYSVLNNNGFTATDGLHYDGDTYKTIYNYIKSKV